MRGFVNILKPSGMTSSDVVVKTRGILKRAKGEVIKTGHLGTLDPNAAGVLPVAVGTAARLFDYSGEKIKAYRAGFCFGKTTDTLDSYGVVTADGGRIPSDEEIANAAKTLTGEIMQLPPIYSALSVNGVKAYKLARGGAEVNLTARKTTVYALDYIGKEGGHYVFDIVCSAGTYVRSIVRDLAERLGTIGYMSYLIRTKSGEFTLENAVNLADFEKNPLKYVLPIETFTDSFPRYNLPDHVAPQALNGVKFRLDTPKDGAFSVYAYGTLIGMGFTEDDGMLHIKTRL